MSNGNQASLLKWIPVVVLGVALIGSYVDMRVRFDRLEQAAAKDAEQDDKIKKFWKLHGWERTQINTLRVEHALPVAEWPDLD